MLKDKNDFSNNYEWSEYIGNYAESRFIEECARRGFTVLQTNDTKQYDFVVELDEKTFKKVQIKAATKDTKHCFRIRQRKNNDRLKKPYTEKDVDVFVIFLVEYNQMYYIPASDILDRINKGVYIYDSSKEDIKRQMKNSVDIKDYKQW